MLQDNVTIVTSLLLVFTSAITGGIIAMRLKLPLIVGYIVMGVVLGSIASGFINRPFLSMLSNVGMTLLLFALGIEFSFQRFRKVVHVVGWAAVVQLLVVFLLVLLILLSFTFPFLASVFIAIVASLSSTAIVVKIVSDQGELDTLYGEATTAWLIIQDLAVVPIMFLLPAVVASAGNQNDSYIEIITTVAVNMGKACVLLLFLLTAGKYILPWVLGKFVRLQNREIFVVTIVAIVFLSAGTTMAIGLSASIGAFLAGLLVAETSQNNAIFSEIRPLRDIFSVIFFVSLGLLVSSEEFIHILPSVALISLLVLGIKGITVFILSRFIGFHRKVSFFIAIALLPLGEFGFILAEEGRKLGALSGEMYTFTVVLSFFTILFGSSFLANSKKLYAVVNAHVLSKIPKLLPDKPFLDVKQRTLALENHVVLCGFGRVGSYIGRSLEMAHIPFVIVDFNRASLSKAYNRGIPAINGDPGDRDILELAYVSTARTLVIAIPDRHTQELVIGNARTLNKNIHIICRSHFEEDQKYLKALGVDAVIQPEFEAAVSITTRLLTSFGIPSEEIAGKITRLKIEHGLG